MRAVLSFVGLLMVVLVVGLLARKQLQPEAPASSIAAPADAQQIQQQIKTELEAAMKAAQGKMPE
ncbi:MAG: hypothetical protein Q4A98_02340 [Comamonadaceae bacterium]|nr:hypothetical protein [Comamonadaceae bacterium]